MPMRSKFVVLFCLLFSAELLAQELIPHAASYTARIKKGISMNGSAIRELKPLGEGKWIYRFDVDSTIADIKESVVFDWRDSRVIPTQYNYELSGFFVRDRQQDVQFDWQKNKALGKHDGKRWQVDLPSGALDRLGYQLQLLMDVATGKQQMDYEVVHKGKLRESQFRVLREERIATVLGELDSIVVEKVRAPDKKRETLLWFAKDDHSLLLKMLQKEEDGEEYEIILKEVLKAPELAK
ncbi:MAG: DUF3108 domain-containing protein [Oleiphilaceae bacterium]|nr:DUF3108 domain-containing protein [Oleiphilaceae bacterium]